MKYVLDASVALKWVLREPDSAKADVLRQEYQNGAHVLVAPDLFPLEVGHGLTRAERRGIVPVSHAVAHLANVLTTAPLLLPSLPLLARATELSSQYRIGVYDCIYVALAERESCDFVTADDKLLKALQPHYSFLLALASLP